MAFTAELERVDTLQSQKVAMEHNAMIKERYRRLHDAEAEQFSNVTQEQHTQQAPRASVFAPEAPVYTPNTPVMEQTPQVTEYVRAQTATPVFQTENVSANIQSQAVAPVIVPTPVAPMQINVYTPTQAAVSTEAQYTFSAAAKKMMMAVAATATVMLSIIGINSGIIKRNEARLDALQRQEQTLIAENEELQKRIEQATSQETIEQFAQENGMIKG